MKVTLNIIVTDEYENKLVTLQHTGVDTVTHSIVHEVEVEIPEPPRGFLIQSISLKEKL